MWRIVAAGVVLIVLSMGVSGVTISERNVIDDGQFDSGWTPPESLSDFGSGFQLFQQYEFQNDDEDEDKEKDEDDDEEEATATPSPSPTATPSPSPTATPSPSPTATGTSTLTSTLTVTSTEPRFKILIATLNETLVTVGESVQIVLQVENAGEQDGTFQANLTVGPETVDSKLVSIGAGENETIVFEYRLDEPGEYEIAVADTSLGRLTVTAASDDGTTTSQLNDDTDGTGPIEVVDASVPADWVKSGYETIVRVTVVNTGNRTANRTLTVTVDDHPVATKTVTLGPNERDVVEIEFEAASGTVAVEGVDAGRINVSERYGRVETGTDDAAVEAESRFGLGIPVLFLVITIIAGVAALSSRS